MDATCRAVEPGTGRLVDLPINGQDADGTRTVAEKYLWMAGASAYAICWHIKVLEELRNGIPRARRAYGVRVPGAT